MTAVQHQRVHQCVDDQIVLPVSGAEKVAAIIQMNLNALVLIRMIGMIQSPQATNGRVDLDSVNVFGAPLQGAADIIALTGADDQHVREGRPARISIQQVRQSTGRKVLISRDRSFS